MGSEWVYALRGSVFRFLLCALIVVSARPAAGVQTIALRGTSPSSGEAASFQSFSLPSLNNRGRVAFAAQLAGDGVTTDNDTGYWIAGAGAFHSVVREGAPAPGLPAGSVFGNVPSLFTVQVPLNDVGDIAVGTSSTQTSGLWLGNHESLSLLASQGSAAPGAENNAGFGALAGIRATLNGRGDVGFYANLDSAPYTTINSTSYTDGLWILNRNGTVANVLAGMSAPAIGPEALFTGFRTFSCAPLNRNGEAALSAFTKAAPAASAITSSIWLASADDLELRGYFGQPLPEIGPNAKLSFNTPAGINSSGAIAAQASVTNGATNTAIVVADATGITVAATSGSPAPGTNGHVFRDTFYEPTMNRRGEIAFYGSEWDGVSGGGSGVWAGPADDLQLIMLQGMPAPGTNATFGSFFRNTPAMNRFGQIATPATLIDTQPGTGTPSLWATDIDGNLMMIGRAGGTLEVAPGDVRTISSLSMLTKHGDDDGKPRGLNDLGQVVFSANFTDGTSGIFLSNAVAHLPGDFNGDHVVDSTDYIVWRYAVPTQNPIADGDRDGDVDENDYVLWREFFGASLAEELAPGGGAVVPEPATMVLTSVFAMALLLRRRRVSFV
jgi:hypothetical protein